MQYWLLDVPTFFWTLVEVALKSVFVVCAIGLTLGVIFGRRL